MQRRFLTLVFFTWGLVAAANGWALPTQYGATGLLSQPTAETLNAGNIGLGLWGNFSETDHAAIVPVSLTMGLGAWMEAYGSYPNLLFNDDETASGRGFANVGMKFRVLGKRSSAFQMAIDAQIRRAVADNPDIDGLTDLMGRVIASFKKNRYGFHINSGYQNNEDPEGFDLKNQYLLGAGVEFFPSMRLRLIAELEALTKRAGGEDGPLEATAGFQYFISPHLNFNLGLGMGLSDASPDWRVLVGLSGTQGVGSYRKPIPKLVQAAPEEEPATEDKPPEAVRPIKIKTLTPLIPKSAVKTSPVAKLEVPVEPDAPEVVVVAAEKLVIPAAASAAALAVAPIPAVAPPIPLPAEISSESPQQKESSPAPAKTLRTVVYRKYRIPEFTFAFDQWSLSPKGREILSQIAEQLRQEGKWLVLRVDGHTDDVGSSRYNERLSLKRATSAATHLVLHAGIDPNRVFVKGFGESQPIVTNDSEEGRATNRRLELLILEPKEELQ